MREEDLRARTKKFAHDCVRMSVGLPQSALGKHIQIQLIRASTSVAANYRAASMAQTKAGFIAKLSIVVEESDESAFWLEFALDDGLVPAEEAEPLFSEAKELTAIFVSSRKTAQRNAGRGEHPR